MSTVFRNTAYNVAGQAAVAVVGLVAVRDVYRELGPDAFGLLGVSELLSVLIALAFDKSVRFTIVREVASHPGDERSRSILSLRSYSFLTWGLFLALTGLLYVSAPFVVRHWLVLSTIDPDLAVSVLRITGFTSLLSLPRSFHTAVMSGLQRMGFINAVDVSSLLAQRLGVIALLAGGHSLFTVLGWLTLTSIAVVVVYIAAVARRLGAAAVLPAWFPSAIRSGGAFNRMMLVSASASTLQRSVDKVLLSRLFEVSAVGQFTTLQSVTSKLSFFAVAVSQAVYPAMSASARDGELAAARARCVRLHRLVSVLSIPGFAIFYYSSDALLRALFDPASAARLQVPCLYLLIGSYISCVVTVPWVYSLAVGRPEITARASLVSLLTGVPVTALAILAYGVSGAGLAWIVYNLVYLLYAVPRICVECLGIRFIDWCVDLCRTCLPLMAPYVVVGGAFAVLDVQSITTIAAGFALASGCFAVVAWFTIGADLRDAWRIVTGSRAA